MASTIQTWSKNSDNDVESITCSMALPRSDGVSFAGFHDAEPVGSWTREPFCTVTLPIGHLTGRLIAIYVKLMPFLHPPAIPAQTVSVTVNGALADTWTLSYHTPRIFSAIVERPAGPDLTIGFFVTPSGNPRALGINDDSRTLGILVQVIKLETMNERPTQEALFWQLGRRRVGTESSKTWDLKAISGFWTRVAPGSNILDVGFRGYEPGSKPILDGAIGIDLDYPGYDGLTLPFPDESQDCVYSSHCLEHIVDPLNAIRDWHRVARVGGFVVIVVPSASLYERRLIPPFRNDDHKRAYTPGSLMNEIERALPLNSYRLRSLEDDDSEYNYALVEPSHPFGVYEITAVIEKTQPPRWQVVSS